MKRVFFLIAGLIFCAAMISCKKEQAKTQNETVHLNAADVPDSENEYFIQKYPDEAFLKEIETGIVDHSTADINPDELTKEQLESLQKQ
ncbi:hypothetical protein [Treponema zioleckii]|uniref:hypothetical protein n=1 Tax=Treponema zioleckii TaxID=331680 RepID=UPI00168AE1BF|nr:hypothetical protein [Treponema zioleckii]